MTMNYVNGHSKRDTKKGGTRTMTTTTVRNVEYVAREIERIDKGSGRWNYLKIGVFEREMDLLETEGTLIGSYERNYGSFYQTFFPFKQEEQWYALYSRD